ncbi:BTAD domain-containing putative transcriptional regulator [Spongiactinospora sp. 9N601]|uniref:BTAD domain-containing putative transcriptional regulator n=1 Tax=Spongiactinospora sp. 9N601 TaxID=3375149 RepID=UPI00379DF9B4
MPTRQPQRIATRRTFGDVIIGLGALLVLVALVGGVPYALLRLTGPPIGPALLDIDLITSQVGPSTLIPILNLILWIVWFRLLICVAVEVYAGIRRIGMPARVPLSGGTQAVANRLVSAALVLFTASAAVIPLVRAQAPPPIKPNVTTVAAVTHQQSAAAAAAEQRQVLHEVRKAKKVYVVQPPHGRHHESLWEIAEKCLGEGRRYPEIFKLNQHKEQPDGTRLHMADLIRPGWVLDMPDDAVNVHIVPAGQPRTETLDDHRGRPAELDGSTRYDAGKGAGDAQAVTPRGETETPEKHKEPQKALPEEKAETPPAERAEAAQEPPPEERQAADDRWAQLAEEDRARAERDAAEQGLHLDVGHYLAGMSLAAAGLLVLLGRRRRAQLWRRAFGRRIARPRDDAAQAEVALRLGADAPGTRMLDIGLRVLGRALALRGRTPPTIYAAHLSATSLDLWIHPPQEEPPAPWTAHDGGRVWRLAAHEGRMLDEHSVADAAAPYPGLVSLGTDESGRVLVDLEAAHGLINITGANTTAALAALAVELGTNRWSDRMHVTLVGFGDDLAAIAPERITCAGSLAEVLPELEARVRDQVREGEVLTGRVNGRAADPAWPPHYLLSAIAPSPEEARRLALLAREGTRTAAGYVVAGDVEHATWTWDITEEGRAKVDALGFEVNAQLLPRRQYAALVELFGTAERFDGEPLSAEREAPIESRPPAVEVRILGPIEISAAEPLEEGRMALAAELIVYLSTHPGGVHPVVLGGVLWPRGVQTAVRDATIERVVNWLGTDSEGRPHLFTDRAGRLRLGPEVRTDWTLFRELVRRSHGDAAGRAALLDRALGLVRGPLLSPRPRGRYAWLADDDLEYDVTAEVADAAHRLCEVRLARGEAAEAVAAVRAGLLLAADDEGLWRDLLRATHATGDTARLRAVVDALHRRAASHPYGGGMAPETEALIDELYPAWRIQSVPSA